MFDNAMRMAFADLEKQKKLPTGLLTAMYGIESNFGRAHDRPGSQYQGPFQLGRDIRRQFGVTNPADWRQSAAAAASYASSNANILRQRLGREPTGQELYMAHQQGAGGASALLAHPNAPAGSLVNPLFVRANGGDPNAPASAFTGRFGSKYDNNLRAVTQGAGPMVPMQPGPVAPGVGGASGSGVPTDVTPNPMHAAMNAPPAAPPVPEQGGGGGFLEALQGLFGGGEGKQSFGDALGNIAGRLGGAGVALMSIDNPQGAAAMAAAIRNNQRAAGKQFRGFAPNGKGLIFTDANGNVEIQPVPEAYQGPKESDTPSGIRTLEILAQRPDLMKLWKETHGEGENSGPALTPEGLDSATELYVSSGGKMGMVGLNKADKTSITNNIAKWAEAHGKTMGDIIANGPKMAGYMSQEREMSRASTRMQTAKAEMDSTLKTLEERAAKLPPELVNGSVPWNMFMQKSAELWNKEGRPELAAYRETIQNAANAYATILARGAAVVPVSMQNRASELFNTHMSPDTIKAVAGTMRDTSDRMMQSMKYSQDNIRAEIAGRPLPHQNVEQDIEKFLTEKRGGPAATSGDIPTVSDKATFDALPSGAEFIGPDGKKRRKN
jgi:hypothetical protein